MGITTGRQQQRKSMGGTFNGKLKKNKKNKADFNYFFV